MLLSIGGVYATWVYTDKTMDAGHHHFGLNMASVTSGVSKGSIAVLTAVEGASTLKISLDDLGVRDYVAEAVINGHIDIIFVPNGSGAQEILTQGVELQIQVVQDENPVQYGGKNVFNIKAHDPISIGNGTKITEQNATGENALFPGVDLSSYIGSFYYRVTAEQLGLSTLITVNDITLPTKADYDAMERALTTGAIGLTITEAPVATNP
jgi:hypothetical protein